MNRLQRGAVLLTLLDALERRGTWCGETRLQNSVYLLEKMCGVPLGFCFVLYRLGPYSFDLNDEVTALRADMLLLVQPRPSYGPSLAPSENAKRLLANFERTREPWLASIEYVAERLGRCRVVDLEKLATALFVTRELNNPDVLARATRLHAVKPHIPIGDAEQAVNKVDFMLHDVVHSGRS